MDDDPFDARGRRKDERMSALFLTLWSLAKRFAGQALSWLVGLGPQKLALLGAAVSALLVWIWIGALRSERAALETANRRLETALAARAAESAARARALDALAATHAADAERGAFLRETIKEAEDAPEDESGAMAPVLDRAFERLRKRAAARAAGA